MDKQISYNKPGEPAGYSPDTEYYWQQLQTRIKGIEKAKKRALHNPAYPIRIAIAAASVLLIVATSASYWFGKTQSSQPLPMPEVSALSCKAMSGKTQVTLPDGSQVFLNALSSITYETSFLHNRKVKLDGEALFEVQKDTEHPFAVEVNDVQLKVTGTRFNVHAYSARPDVRIALLDGEVSVLAGEREFLMAPGDITSFDRATHRLSIEKGDVAFESFWANSHCSFVAKPLGYICKYLERWYNVDIRLDPALAYEQVYTFSITDEPLEEILQIMSRINPIRYSFGEDRTVIIKSVKSSKK